MNLKNTKRLFREEKWLQPLLYYHSPSKREDFDTWIERDVRSITFRDFSPDILHKSSALKEVEIYLVDSEQGSKKAELNIRYIVVYASIESQPLAYGVYDQCTVGQRIAGLKKDVDFKGRRFIAVVREKHFSSAPSDFGDLVSYDIFKFPPGWQSPT